MAIERKPVTIHYRKFQRDSTYPTATLEQLTITAMNDTVDAVRLRDNYRLRVRTVGDDNFFVNTYMTNGADGNPLVFGDVIHFTKGHLQALFRVAQTISPAAPVQQMPAPAQSEYVHSQMFWMIKGDHVFVLQSISLRTEQCEEYLKWLLSEKTQTLPSNLAVVLAAKFDQQFVGGDLDDIQEIVVGGVVAVPPRDTAALPDQNEPVETERIVTSTGEVGAARQTGWAQAKEILSTLLGGDANVNQFMQGVPPDADLRVEVHIGYKTRKKQVSRVALRQLETGLRNLPDSQLQVKSKGASMASDGSIRLHHPASIRLIKLQDGNTEKIGSLLDPADVLRAMHEAYHVFLANGKIVA
jgi:hypothetical protein